METIAVIDFESNGEPASQGGRATEIAVVLVRAGRIIDRYHNLMRTDSWISPFVVELTGITNEMMQSAPPARRVMTEARAFVGSLPMVAHHASFDSLFWHSEIERLGEPAPKNEFACTMLLARRVYPSSPNHKLGTLSRLLKFTTSSPAHRAMVDTEMAANLLTRIQDSLRSRHGLLEAPHALLAAAQKIPKQHFQARLPALALRMGVPHRLVG